MQTFQLILSNKIFFYNEPTDSAVSKDIETYSMCL